jgi:hypothetical protein
MRQLERASSRSLTARTRAQGAERMFDRKRATVLGKDVAILMPSPVGVPRRARAAPVTRAREPKPGRLRAPPRAHALHSQIKENHPRLLATYMRTRESRAMVTGPVVTGARDRRQQQAAGRGGALARPSALPRVHASRAHRSRARSPPSARTARSSRCKFLSRH